MVYRVPTPRGYNPLDVRHYREFLAFVVNDDRPIRGNDPYTQQVIPNFEVGNPQLFRLFAVTHRVAPATAPPLPGEWKPLLVDPAPPAPPPLMPNSPATLPPHTLSVAANPQPRAWIVPHAEPMPAGGELAALKRCDFSRTVLITGVKELPQPEGAKTGPVRITEYRPNRVTVEVDGAGGWLVLAEVWFPGWTCRVDGVEVPVYRESCLPRGAASDRREASRVHLRPAYIPHRLVGERGVAGNAGDGVRRRRGAVGNEEPEESAMRLRCVR